MNLGIASYITSAGLKAVTSAGILGPYFAIKYFLPIYDYRIDKTICREISGATSALSISSLNLVSATHNTLFGEKIYSNFNYDVSDNSYLFWKSSMGSLLDGENNNVVAQQSVTTDVNLYSGKPLSVVVSGSKFESPSTGIFNISGTHIVSGGELSTVDPLSASTWPTSAFYRVAGYTPNANGLTSATGTFKCRIPPSNSSYKFNGLALYAVKVDSNGFDDYGNGTTFGFNPTLFSVILFDQAQYKEKDVGGVNDFEISVDLSFDWDLVSSGTTNVARFIETNHWVKVPTSTSTSAYAINYDGDVVISSSAVAGSYAPKAKLTVTDPYKQQLRLANDNERFTDFRTIRFANNLTGPIPDSTNRAVLSIDTSCPDDSLLQLGYKTSAVGIKSVAIGCYSSAVGYMQGVITDFTDPTPVDLTAITNSTGGYTVAIGVKNYAEGFGSIALGYQTSSVGYLNFAGGESSLASYGIFDPNGDKKDGVNFAYGKEVSAISRTNANAYFDYGNGDVLADDESYGSNIAFGVRSLANGGLSFVNGALVSAIGVNAFGLGYKNLAKGHFSFVGGINSSATSDMCFAYGNNVLSNSPLSFGYGRNIALGDGTTNSTFNIGIGDGVSANKHHAIALGRNALASGLNSISIGQNNNTLTVAAGTNSFAIGEGTSALGKYSIAIGSESISIGEYSISTGYKTSALGKYSIAIGSESISIGESSFAANNYTSAIGKYSTSFGYSTLSEGDYSQAIGYKTSALGMYSFAGGWLSKSMGLYSFAFGANANANANGSISLGTDSDASHENSVAIGYGAKTTGQNQIVIGSCDDTVLIKGSRIDIGCGSNVNIPGINQFNDSIKVDISMTGRDNAGNAADNKRTLSITIIRNGITHSITMLETGYNTNSFIVNGNPTGNIYFGVRGFPNDRKYKAVNLATINFPRIVVNPIEFNIAVLLDKEMDEIIIIGNSLSGITEYSDYNIEYDTIIAQRIYVGITDFTSNYGSDVHYLYWMPNINVMKTWFDYDKAKTNIRTELHTLASRGDGICVYDFGCRTVSDIVKINIEGIVNGWYNSGAYNLSYGGTGHSGFRILAGGLFINSGSSSFGVSPVFEARQGV